MIETTVQANIQIIIQGMSEFDDADVTINDWSLLDQSNSRAPYVIITNASNIDSRQDTSDEQVTYGLPLFLIERFVDWETSLNNFRARRQALFNKFTAAGTARSAGGLEGFTINRVRTEGPITEYYDRNIPAELIATSLPAFLMQEIVLECEEF